MYSQVITSKLRILAPDDGMALTDGTTYTTGTVYLAWNADASKWREVHESEIPTEEERESSPRTFSKYRLVSALMQAQVWPQVKAWIESVPGAYDLYLAAEDISEDEPLLAQGIAAVKELLGWTDEQVEAVLAASVKE